MLPGIMGLFCLAYALPRRGVLPELSGRPDAPVFNRRSKGQPQLLLSDGGAVWGCYRGPTSHAFRSSMSEDDSAPCTSTFEADAELFPGVPHTRRREGHLELEGRRLVNRSQLTRESPGPPNFAASLLVPSVSRWIPLKSDQCSTSRRCHLLYRLLSLPCFVSFCLLSSSLSLLVCLRLHCQAFSRLT